MNKNSADYNLEILEDFILSGYFPNNLVINKLNYITDNDNEKTVMCYVDISPDVYKNFDKYINIFENSFDLFIGNLIIQQTETANIDILNDIKSNISFDTLADEDVLSINIKDNNMIFENLVPIQDGEVVKLQRPLDNTYSNQEKNNDGLTLGICDNCNAENVNVDDHICKNVVELEENPESITEDYFTKNMLKYTATLIKNYIKNNKLELTKKTFLKACKDLLNKSNLNKEEMTELEELVFNKINENIINEDYFTKNMLKYTATLIKNYIKSKNLQKTKADFLKACKDLLNKSNLNKEEMSELEKLVLESKYANMITTVKDFKLMLESLENNKRTVNT